MRAALCDEMIVRVPPNCDIDGATSNELDVDSGRFLAVLPSSLAIEPCVRRTRVLALTSHDFSPHLVGWLVFPQPHVNRVPQEVVCRGRHR